MQPHICLPLPGPKAQAIIERDQTILSPSYTRDYPLVVARGEGCWIEDVDGNRFLDLTAGIAVTASGHCHPRVVAAIHEQSAQLIHMSGTDFYYESQVSLAEKLTAQMSGTDPNKAFFCNSGAEANEAAIKLARHHTGRQHIIAFYGAFHGRSYGALSLTCSKALQRQGFAPLLPSVHHVPFPNPRECPDEMSPEAYSDHCIEHIQRLLKHKIDPKEVAAIVVEPMQGEGGYIVPPQQFHPDLQQLCHQHGILYVIDEVQAGMGRTGKFYAHQHFGVEPDIITLAKGIASGLPLGAMLSKASVMDWPPGSHASTFGGNPVACAAALATVDLLESELIDNVTKQGDFLRTKLLHLHETFPSIVDVRGLGLMQAIELKTAEQRNQIIDQAFYQGLLLLGCGSSSIRFSPALCINEAELVTGIDILENVLRKL